MQTYLSVGQAAVVLGVSISTLRRWESVGAISPSFRTIGKHRRYALSDLQDLFGLQTSKEKERKVVGYARVSSHDQKEDLERQKLRLEDYCKQSQDSYVVIQDLGSGLKYDKKGLLALIKMICRNEVSELVLTHRDRLLRFGSPLLFKLCEYYGTKVTILEDEKDASFEEQLAKDVIEIMTVFTSKLYGRRSGQNRRARAA